MAWIGIDLDGTLAHYDGWIGEHHIGDPIAAMAERVRGWLASGIECRIMTARVCRATPDRDIAAITETIQNWCEAHLGQRLMVTNEKDYGMVALFDDRAYRVVENTGEIVGGFAGFDS